MIDWFLHNPIGMQVTATVIGGVILGAIGLVWAAIWSFPKRRDERRKLEEIHQKVVSNERRADS